jgi:hypothetical protein
MRLTSLISNRHLGKKVPEGKNIHQVFRNLGRETMVPTPILISLFTNILINPPPIGPRPSKKLRPLMKNCEIFKTTAVAIILITTLRKKTRDGLTSTRDAIRIRQTQKQSMIASQKKQKQTWIIKIRGQNQSNQKIIKKIKYIFKKRKRKMIR